MKLKLLQLITAMTKFMFYGLIAQVFCIGVLIASDLNAQKIESIRDVHLNLSLRQASLMEVFKNIESQTEFRFAYDNSVINKGLKIDLYRKGISVAEILMVISRDAKLKFRQVNNYINVDKLETGQKPEVEIVLQSITITGNVTSAEDGDGLPGVNVSIKGTNLGTVTDIDGNYSVEVPDEHSVLIFSSVGFLMEEAAVGNQTVIDMIMSPDITALAEIIVTALGIKREEKALGYAVQRVSGEALQKVQGVDVATSLTGKVAGLLVRNSTDFNVQPELTIRGETPLLVIDGIAYENKSLNDISSEDIESMSVLKGATASALYGFRGQGGAILITTKNGSTSQPGITVDFTTNTMFSAGYLAIPEKQSVYGRGNNNTYNINQDQSWGQVMDGSIQTQWDPIAKEFRDFEYLPIGKDNFQNFLEQGYITNNNLNVAFREDNISLRSSVNWTQNKGRYPNSKLDKYTYTLGGDINLDRFQLTSNLSYARRTSPNMGSNGYTSYDPMYTLLIWGPVDYNVLDYKDNYWIVPGVLQNNHYGYDYEADKYRGKNQNSPYFDRYERTNEVSRDIFNADLSMSYDITDWLKATVRSGLDFYVDRGQIRISQGSYTSSGNTSVPGNPYTWNGSRTGAYMTGRTQGYSINSDFLLAGNKALNKFEVEYLAGGTIFYQRDDNLNAETVGGISIPGFFSLNASVNPAVVSESTNARQVNSFFGRLAVSWNRLIYLDFTGRNDWVSMLANPNVPESDRSYFYPSISGSFVISELLPESTMDWLDLLKVRNSYTQAKTPPNPYAINSVFSVYPGTWNDLNGASAPSSLYLNTYSPNSYALYEVGLQSMMFGKRLNFDVTYYDRREFDILRNGPLSAASGYTGIWLNTDEEFSTQGWEVAITATPIKKEDWQLDLAINWTSYKNIYTKLDTTYSEKKPWVKVGERTDAYVGKEFLKVPETGQHIYSNGRIQRSEYQSVFGYRDPDWLWGVNSTLRYKNFSLFVSMDGVVGGLMNTRTESYMWQSGVHPASVTEERALDVATPGSENYIGEGVKVVGGSVTFDTDGNITSDSREYAPNDEATTYLRAMKDLHNSSAWGGTGTTADAYENTFLKLREISLTYNVPASLLNNWGAIKNASISFIGQNVLLWSKDFKYSDPDGGREDFSDPSVRYLGANIKLTF